MVGSVSYALVRWVGMSFMLGDRPPDPPILCIFIVFLVIYIIYLPLSVSLSFFLYVSLSLFFTSLLSLSSFSLCLSRSVFN